MVTIAITGGSSGLGLEAARQLAMTPEVNKIVITGRSKDRAESAIAKLVKQTGKDESFFQIVILDLGDVNSINAATAAFPAFDRILLNAGGLGTGKMHASGNGMTDSMVINTVGHAMFVDGLIAAGKISAGKRVVYVGSEVSRALWSFVPLLPNYCGNFKEKDIEWAITKDYNGPGSCFPLRRQMGDYKNAKIIGHMHFTHLAKEHPEIHVMSMSPGAVGGTFAETAYCPVKQLIAYSPCLFRCLCVTHACFAPASTVIGGQRYVDVLTGDEPKWKAGSIAMSPPCCGCLCFWGACGTMVDNRPLVPYFRDEALCEKTTAKVREWSSKWASQAPAQMTMDQK